MKQTEDNNIDYERIVALCQMVLRVATGIILTAFVLIIAVTTVSTGTLVRAGGQALYYVDVFSILVSVVTWLLRVRMEKRAGMKENPS